MIIVDLDNLLAPTAGVNFEKLAIFDHHTLKYYWQGEDDKEDEEFVKQKTLQNWVDRIAENMDKEYDPRKEFITYFEWVRKIIQRIVEVSIFLFLIIMQPFVR